MILSHVSEEQAWALLDEAIKECPHCFGMNNFALIDFRGIEVVDEKNEVLARGGTVFEVCEQMIEAGMVGTRLLAKFGLLH